MEMDRRYIYRPGRVVCPAGQDINRVRITLRHILSAIRLQCKYSEWVWTRFFVGAVTSGWFRRGEISPRAAAPCSEAVTEMEKEAACATATSPAVNTTVRAPMLPALLPADHWRRVGGVLLAGGGAAVSRLPLPQRLTTPVLPADTCCCGGTGLPAPAAYWRPMTSHSRRKSPGLAAQGRLCRRQQGRPQPVSGSAVRNLSRPASAAVTGDSGSSYPRLSDVVLKVARGTRYTCAAQPVGLFSG